MENVSIDDNKILTDKQKKIVNVLNDYLDHSCCYWAGGTALSLIYQHRLSDDIDIFFTKDNVINFDRLINNLGKIFEIEEETNIKNDTLNIFVDGVKVQLLRDFYNQVGLLLSTDKELKIASIEQIGMMKILAIMNRGSKKDFIDLYMIAQKEMKLEKLIDSISQRYPQIKNKGHLIKSLHYFVDAEKEESPKMLIDLKWQDIKKFFQEFAPQYTVKLTSMFDDSLKVKNTKTMGLNKNK